MTMKEAIKLKHDAEIIIGEIEVRIKTEKKRLHGWKHERQKALDAVLAKRAAAAEKRVHEQRKGT